jgi:hypothetical protein
MVKSIAERAGVAIPRFFGYTGWPIVLSVPVWHQNLPIFHWTPGPPALTMRIALSDAEMRHIIAW